VYRYRNRNTGQQVERAERSVRLDHLPNWELISAPVERPARRASTEAWRAYAVARGMTSDEAAAHTRDELVALYDAVDG